MLLHLAAGVFSLTLVHLPAPPTALEDQAVALVFEPAAPAPRAVPPPVPTPSAVTPGVPPEPPAPPEAPVLAAVTPSPPEPPSPTEAPPPPAVPPPPPAANALAPPVPVPPHLARQPPPRPLPAKPLRTATAAPSRTAPAAPTGAAAQEAPSAEPSKAGEDTAPPRAAQPAPITADWQRALGSWLAAHKTYPDEARRRGEEGRVVLHFTVDRSGKVLGVALASGSGWPRLDDAAQAMLRGASLPAFPTEMGQERVTVTVQIRYRLTD